MCREHKFGPKGPHACGPQGFAQWMPGFRKMLHHHMRQWCSCGTNVLYNIDDLGESYLITVLLPGRSKEDVKVSLINGYLNVKAPKPKTAQKEETEDRKEEDPTIKRQAFKFIDVNMDIPLPPGANPEAIKSVISNGVLKIKITKRPPKDINVSEEYN